MSGISDEAREWGEKHGIKFDDDGLPIPEPGPSGPARPCLRCGRPTERAQETVYYLAGKSGTGVTCSDCFKLSMTDPEAYWKVFRDREKTEAGDGTQQEGQNAGP